MERKPFFKCEIEGCNGTTSKAFCDECTEYLLIHRAYKAIVCSYCNRLIKFSESNSMEVELVEECSCCKDFRITGKT